MPIRILEDVLQNVIRDQLNDVDSRMADPSLMSSVDDRKGCPTLVVATRAADAEQRPITFRSHNCPEDYHADKCKIWEAVRCTSAATTFFRPMFVRVPPGSGQWHLDGGLQHKDPSNVAPDEARRLWLTIKRFCLISIGTRQQGTVELMDIRERLSTPDEKVNND